MVQQLQTFCVHNLRKRIIEIVSIISTVRRIIEKSHNSGTEIQWEYELKSGKSAKIESIKRKYLARILAEIKLNNSDYIRYTYFTQLRQLMGRDLR